MEQAPFLPIPLIGKRLGGGPGGKASWLPGSAAARSSVIWRFRIQSTASCARESGGEDRALVVLEDFDPGSDVGGVVRPGSLAMRARQMNAAPSSATVPQRVSFLVETVAKLAVEAVLGAGPWVASWARRHNTRRGL